MINLLEETFKIRRTGLFLVVLGPSGAGKSHFIGTHPGRTLYLYGSGESHGPNSASKNNKDLLPIAWDRIKKGDEISDLTPDQILPRIKERLDPQVIKANGVKCVALDSWTNLALDIKKSTLFKQRCTDAKGNHNAFKETEVLGAMLLDVVKCLQTLVDYHDVDVITTLDLQIQNVGDDGTILESKPSLPTFGVAKALVQTFGDILVLGRIGEKRTPVFQSFAKAATSSIDRESKVMVKYVEYSPRLTNVNELPETIEASVSAIMKLKGV